MECASQKWKRRFLRALPWLVFFLLLAGMAAVRGLTRSYTINYEIMNGDFQNYNPVRRLLAGQRPYEDFTVYLGAGELYSVAAVLLFVGNSFARSMFATNMLTWFFFELLAFAVAFSVFGTAKRARSFTLIICGVCFGFVQGLPILKSIPFLGDLLGYAAANGNSARMIRSASLPIAVLAVLGGLWLYQNHPPKPGARGFKKWFSLPPALLVPLVAGALVPWSNDMGGALYIALSLTYGMLLIRQYGTKIKSILLAVLRYIGVSILGLGVSVLLVSGGHPFAWLRQTRGAGNYQGWYYGSAPEVKLTYLGNMELDAAFWVCLALAAAFGVCLFLAKKREDILSAGACFTLTLGMVLWNILYCVLSTAHAGPAGGAQALLAILVPALVFRGIGALPALRGKAAAQIAAPASALLAAVVLGVGLTGQLTARAGENSRGEGYTYVPSLGGWLGDQAEKLATEESITAGKTVWSTYASALEAMTGRFQPSGTDYIIHVLGDRQRLEYLQTFQAGGYDLVETPSPKASDYERWSRNANWWFYRELYRYWAPVNTTYACGGMHLFWQQTGADGALPVNGTVALTQKDAATVTLTVTTDEPDFNGVADVQVQYSQSVAKNFRLKGGVASFVRVDPLTEKALCDAAGRESENCAFYIPTDRTAYDIPVTIANGVGTVALSALPSDAASLTVAGADVTAFFADWEYFFE